MRSWWRPLSGSHPKIARINDLIEEVNQLWGELLVEGREAGKTLREVFSYRVVSCDADSCRDRGEIPSDAVKIVCTLLNRHEFEHYCRYYAMGFVPSPDLESVSYSRNFGTIVRTGDGCDLLTRESYVTPAEWEAFRRGDIPQRLLKRQWQVDLAERTLTLRREYRPPAEERTGGDQSAERALAVMRLMARYPELNCRFQ